MFGLKVVTPRLIIFFAGQEHYDSIVWGYNTEDDKTTRFALDRQRGKKLEESASDDKLSSVNGEFVQQCC